MISPVVLVWASGTGSNGSAFRLWSDTDFLFPNDTIDRSRAREIHSKAFFSLMGNPYRNALFGPDFSLLTIAENIRASYWFVPSIMVFLSILLASFSQWLDGVVDPVGLTGLGWLYTNEAVGARDVLSTIAGSMITVAGVTFSMTMVSVSNASAQFGPRLVNNFMRDRGNQITLGTFISTFVFCLMVLRGVRNGVDSNEDLVAFVPHISVLIAVLLALASITVLTYFIHHIPETINVGNIVANLGRDMKRRVAESFPEDNWFPESVAKRQTNRAEFTKEKISQSVAVKCERSGYAQVIDNAKILDLAIKRDLVVRVEFLPGDFSLSGETLLHAWPASNLEDGDIETLRRAFSFNVHPASAHNIRFLVDQLVEIIGRALSPGVNDPYTAINCLNWLMDSLATASRAAAPTGEQFDGGGNLRIVANAYDFERLAESIFDQSLQYVCSDRNVALHSLQMIATVGSQTAQSDYRVILKRHAQRIASAAADRIAETTLTMEIDSAARTVTDILDGRADLTKLRESHAWLGGTA